MIECNYLNLKTFRTKHKSDELSVGDRVQVIAIFCDDKGPFPLECTGFVYESKENVVSLILESSFVNAFRSTASQIDDWMISVTRVFS